MNRAQIAIVWAGALGGLACGGPSNIGGRALAFPEGRSSTEMSGQIVDARCYFNTGATGGDHQYCAFTSARAGLPLLFLSDDGGLAFVTNSPATLAPFVTARVSVRGARTPNGQLLRVDAIRVASADDWRVVAP